MEVKLLKYPTEEDWMEVKRRALVTIGKNPVSPPSVTWKQDILAARHSPIRSLVYSFYIVCPSWVSVHLCRHVHAQPFVKSQRNDRQNEYDRNKAPQDAEVCMIYDVNAEELMNIANKRLCNQASKETQTLTRMMCNEVIKVTPEIEKFLVPMCEHCGKVCYEMNPCGRVKKDITYWRENWLD